MPLSGAERQRRYLQKLRCSNPEKLEEIKKKNLEQTKRKYRKAKDLNESEQDLQRQKWRKQKRERNVKEVPKESQKNTEEKEKRRFRYLLAKENSKLKSTIDLLLRKIKCQKKSIYRYKKQVNHLKEIVTNLRNPPSEKDTVNVNINIIQDSKQTPISKTDTFIQECLPQISTSEKNIVKKVLFENILIKDSLSEQYSQTTNNQEKNTLKKFITNDTIAKYKMKTKLSSVIGLKGRIRIREQLKKRKICRLKEVGDFLSRDDNSRATAGKKEYRTLHKKREQVRYLLDTMKKLHTKYKGEGGKLSYEMFTRYKPFYILSPKLSDRNTCACVKHANLNFMAENLKKLNVIKSDNLAQLVSTIACNVNDVKCMYGECNNCSNKSVICNLLQRNLKDVVTWKRWVTKKHEYDNKITKRTVKEEVTQTLEILLQTFRDQMLLFKTHYFNITHQYTMYKNCKEKLTEQEVLLHCDFSENYGCKLAEEVQALHFGASKRQISLHTGVFYAKYDDKPQTTSFCTISSNTNHSPGAIWAHLTPILKLIKDKYPKVTILHFYSDGPTTQYRQKKNFYMLNKMISLFRFEKATWSFFEASHGKGAADGIGGATKRNLDSYVAHGQDISDAEAAYKALVNSNSKIKYFLISDENVDTLVKDLDSTTKDLIPVPNTIAIHQVISMQNPDIIKFRKLSCFCGITAGYCDCFDVKEHNLKQHKTNNDKKRKIKGKSPKNIKKRRIERSSDTSESECEINYAESDESSWKGDNSECEHEDNGNTNDGIIETKSKENNVAYSTKTESAGKHIDRKVTILSDIRYKPESKGYIDLNKYSPFTLKRIDTNFQINNDIYKNPIPSTSGVNNNTIKKEKMAKIPKLDLISKECDVNEVDTAETVMEDKENDNNKGYFKQSIRTEIKNDGDCENNLKIETKSEKLTETETRDMTYNINDSVLVRYYEKKKWVYYVGFIEGVVFKIAEIHYKVRFLKTVKKPQLKFITSKKADKDVVPAACIVKKLHLKFVSNEFKLADDHDQIYF